MKNFEEARRWYGLCADLNDPDSQDILGFMMFHGKGGKLDPIEAKKLFEKAVSQNCITATCHLAEIHYSLGEYAKARELYEIGSTGILHESQFRYGQMLVHGYGGDPDLVKGINLIYTAAMNGHAAALQEMKHHKHWYTYVL